MSDTNMLVGLSQSYIEALTKELETAEYCHEQYQKAAQKAKSEYDQSLDWEKCLKDLVSKLGTTYGLVNSLDAYITKMVEHSNKICTTIGLANSATDILMICTHCLSQDTEELKGDVKGLLEIIYCLNDPILDPNVSIMKCLEDLKTKVDIGLLAILDAIKELLNLMRCITELHHKVCTTPETSSLEGLIDDLNRLTTILDCSYPHGSAVSDMACEEVDSAYATPVLGDLNCPTCKNDCGEEIVGMPVTLKADVSALKPNFCNECGNTYYTDLVKEYNDAAKQTCYAKCVWDYFTKLEEEAKSNMDGTKAALDAAKNAKAKCN